jgi:hypothetical protein
MMIFLSASSSRARGEVLRPGPPLVDGLSPLLNFRQTHTAATGMHSHPNFGLTQQGVLARRETYIAGQDEFATHAPDAASDFRDADHWGFGETDERVHQDRESGRPNSRGDVPGLAGQIKVGKVKLRIRALEYYDA